MSQGRAETEKLKPGNSSKCREHYTVQSILLLAEESRFPLDAGSHTILLSYHLMDAEGAAAEKRRRTNAAKQKQRRR